MVPFQGFLKSVSSLSGVGFLAFSVLYAIGHADDWDGDGYDDTTGEWVGYGGGGGNTDSDGDGLYDNDETTIYYTDPGLWDTDSDGESDGSEVAGGFNPLDASSNSASSGGGGPPYNDGTGDPDGDGISTDTENYFYFTNPNLFDTDGDGLGDGEEIAGYEVWYYYSYYSHTDYIYNSETGNYDPSDVYNTSSYPGMIYTDPLRADTDYDLLPDGYEKIHGLDPTISSIASS